MQKAVPPPLRTPKERRTEHGVAIRKKAPLEAHAELRSPARRDCVAILAASDRTRIPELVPVRYERMLVNPFAYLRGAAAVMAEDLKQQVSPGIQVQVAVTVIS